jgi:hypothetical protein
MAPWRPGHSRRPTRRLHPASEKAPASSGSKVLAFDPLPTTVNFFYFQFFVYLSLLTMLISPHFSSSVARLQKLTLRRDKKDDPSTAAALPTPSDKNMVLGMSRSIVRVSSPPSEGKLISPRTGFVISWDGATKRAMIVTLFTYFKKKPHEPQPEVHDLANPHVTII